VTRASGVAKNDKTEAEPKVLTIQCAIERSSQSLNLKVASGGRKRRTYEAVEDILMPFGKTLGMNEPLGIVTRKLALTYIGDLKTQRGQEAKRTPKQNHFIYIQKVLRSSGVDLFEEGDCPKAPLPTAAPPNKTDVRMSSRRVIIESPGIKRILIAAYTLLVRLYGTILAFSYRSAPRRICRD
jgi:hypothetical protein